MNNNFKTLEDLTPEKLSFFESAHFTYQENLTQELDILNSDFSQDIINEIVLWKVNRYAEIPQITLDKINRIDKHATVFDEQLTREILSELLDSNCKGFGLPMISTILRFKNPNIYQIIDQRVYRFIYGKELDLKPCNSDKEIEQQINLYLKYLIDLREKCNEKEVKFKDSDRTLYLADKTENKMFPLKNY